MRNVLHMIEIQLKERVKVFDFGVYSTMADSGRHFLIKDIVILYCRQISTKLAMSYVHVQFLHWQFSLAKNIKINSCDMKLWNIN